MDWYYVTNGQQVGPVSQQDMQALIQAGTVAGDTLVWREGMQDWVAQNTVAAEFAAPAVPAPGTTGPVAPPAGGKTGLSLKKREPAATSAQPAAAAAGGSAQAMAAAQAAAGGGTCSQCGRRFPLDQMVAYEGATICAECKPAFFQRLQEGAVGGGGDTPNGELTAQARANLSGSWGSAMGVCIVAFVMLVLISGVAGAANAIVPLSGNLVQILILPPLLLGFVMYFLGLGRQEAVGVGTIFEGYNTYGTVVLAYFVRSLIVGICALLVLLPGIVVFFMGAGKQDHGLIQVGVALMVPAAIVSIWVQYMFAMVMYVIADNASVGAMGALSASRQMMAGKKWKFFCLNLRFVIWSILCIFTFFIGFLWLAPYMASPDA